MSNTKRIIIAVVAVAVIASGSIWYIIATSNKTAAPAASNSTSTNDTSDSGTVASTITYDGNTFSVSNNKVASGATVKVVNNSSEDLDFDSDPHPTHTDNSELNEGDIAPGESKTFTLTKEGTWGFHNHLDASQKGEITVE